MIGKLFLLGLSFLTISNEIWAQPYECVTPGTSQYYAIHNKKGKITDYQKTVVLGIEDRDSCRAIRQLAMYFDKDWNPMTDKNGKAIEPDSTASLWGEKGIISDISYYAGAIGDPLDQKTIDYLESGGYEYHFKSEGSPDFIYPDQMTVGDTLCRYHSEDWCIKVATGKRALSQDSFDAVVYVAAEEKVQTPAGEFDCYKIVAEIESRIKSPMYNPVERYRFVEWVSRGVGAVRLGEEDKKGRLMDYMELVKIEWPQDGASVSER